MRQMLGPLYVARNISRGVCIVSWALRHLLSRTLFQPFHMIKCVDRAPFPLRMGFCACETSRNISSRSFPELLACALTLCLLMMWCDCGSSSI